MTFEEETPLPDSADRVYWNDASSGGGGASGTTSVAFGEVFGEGFEAIWDRPSYDELIEANFSDVREDINPDLVQGRSVKEGECRIGLSKFKVPPVNINVNSQFKAGSMSVGALRRQNSPKFASGQKETTISITLYFPNAEEIYGVAPNSSSDIDFRTAPDEVIDKFASSLKGLITQFKYAPFLPVRNIYLNQVHDITAVALKNLTITNVQDYPGVFAVQLDLYKFNHEPFLPMVSDFNSAVHWGRLRSYVGRAAARIRRDGEGLKQWGDSDTFNDLQEESRELLAQDVFATPEAILERYQYDTSPLGSEVTFDGPTIKDVKEFEFWYPFYVPSQLELPSLDDLDVMPEEAVHEAGRGWWDETLSLLGLGNIITNDVYTDYDGITSVLEDRGQGYLIGSQEFQELILWLEGQQLVVDAFGQDKLEEYYDKRLSEIPNATRTNGRGIELRREVEEAWMINLYRFYRNDVVHAEMLADDERYRRRIQIHEWLVPMEKLELDMSLVHVQNMSLQMGNLIARHQLEMHDDPVHQHIGGEDTILSMDMIVTGGDESATLGGDITQGSSAEAEIIKLRKMFDIVSGIARVAQGYGTLGFLGIKSAVTRLAGIKHLIPLNFSVETIPNYPHSYRVQMQFVDFDILQAQREALDASQQAALADEFGKHNPFLRMKQHYAAFSCYPDFPLDVRDEDGNVVGHLDPSFYFKSFDILDDASMNANTDTPVSFVMGEDVNGDPIGYDILDNAKIVDGENSASIVDYQTVVSTGSSDPDFSPASQHIEHYAGGDIANHVNLMVKDMQKRDIGGSMVRAFPTYMLWLIDEAGHLFAFKMFDNFFGLQSLLDFSLIRSQDSLADVLTMRVSNVYSNLSTSMRDYLEESDDEDFTAQLINRFTTQLLRRATGAGGMVLDPETMNIRPGLRVHLRAGYSSRPDQLETIFNGKITEVQQGEVMTLVAQSDGIELGSVVNSADKDGSSGELDGSLGNLYMSEPRDLMLTLLTEGSGIAKEVIAHATKGEIFSENRNGIKHFGMMLYAPLRSEDRDLQNRRKGLVTTQIAQFTEEHGNDLPGPFQIFEESVRYFGDALYNLAARPDFEIFKRNIYPGNGLGVDQFLGGDLGDIALTSVIQDPELDRGAYGDAWSNIFAHFGLSRSDTEPEDEVIPEVSFRAQTYMRTVWDLFRTCAAMLPDYIVAIRPFEDRSTVFYGKPHWMYTSGLIPITTGRNFMPEITGPNEELANIHQLHEEEYLSRDYEEHFNSAMAEAMKGDTLSDTLSPFTGETRTSSASDISSEGFPENGRQYIPLINSAAAAEGIDAAILASLLYQESRFNPDTIEGRNVSSAGAQGIAQFMPSTAADLGIDPLDPDEAIPAAAKYLRQQLDAFNGDYVYALAAYNWGPRNVSKWGGSLSSLPKQTRDYVQEVPARAEEYRSVSGGLENLSVEPGSGEGEYTGEDALENPEYAPQWYDDLSGESLFEDDYISFSNFYGHRYAGVPVNWSYSSDPNLQDPGEDFDELSPSDDAYDEEFRYHDERGAVAAEVYRKTPDRTVGEVHRTDDEAYAIWRQLRTPKNWMDKDNQHETLIRLVMEKNEAISEDEARAFLFGEEFDQADDYYDAYDDLAVSEGKDTEAKGRLQEILVYCLNVPNEWTASQDNDVSDKLNTRGYILMDNFLRLMWQNPYARGWVALVADQQFWDGSPDGDPEYDMAIVADVMKNAYAGDPSVDSLEGPAMSFMQGNAREGTGAFGAAEDLISGFTEPAVKFFGAIRQFATGSLGYVRASVMQNFGATLSLVNAEANANILNQTFDDSIYYSAGVNDEGDIVDPLAYYTDNPFTREYGEPVLEIREPFQRMHHISSFQHILHNGIIESTTNVATVVTAVSNGKQPATVYFDKNAPTESQVEKVVESGIFVSEEGFFNRIFNPINSWRNATTTFQNKNIDDLHLAKRIAKSHLKEEIKNIYDGEIIILGDTSIRPYDLVFIADYHSKIFGWIEVQDVIHHFTPEMGFITTIVPNAVVTVNDSTKFYMLASAGRRNAMAVVRERLRRQINRPETRYREAPGYLFGSETLGIQTVDAGEEIPVVYFEGLAEEEIRGTAQTIGGHTSASKAIVSQAVRQLDYEIEDFEDSTIFQHQSIEAPFQMFADSFNLAQGLVWGFIRDNLLDQNAVHVHYLNQRGRPMDAGLNFADGVAVGQMQTLDLVVGGLGIAESQVITGNDGDPRINLGDVIPQLAYEERQGVNQNVNNLSLFIDQGNALMRELSGRDGDGGGLDSDMVDVYWVRLERVVDADTFEVEVISHYQNGTHKSASTISLPGDGGTIRLAGTQAFEDPYKYIDDIAAAEDVAELTNNLGLKATLYAKSKFPVGREFAIRIANANNYDIHDRTLAHVFHNAPASIVDQDARNQFMIRAANRVPLVPFNAFMEDGQPYTFDYQLVLAGYAQVFISDLRQSVSGTNDGGKLPMNKPKHKFEKAIKDRVVTPAQFQDRVPGFGMVLKYDKQSNTAMVQMTKPGSDQPGEIYKGVICPLTLGVQGVAPEAGRICYVVFEGGTQSKPVIIAFYSPDHFEVDFNKQNKVSDEIPHYLKNT